MPGMIQTVFIDVDSLEARAASTGSDLPAVILRQRNDETVEFAFMSGGTVAALDGFVSARCIVRELPTEDVLLLDNTLEEDGTDTSTRYKAVWTPSTLDGPVGGALRTFLAQPVLPVAGRLAHDCWMEVVWVDASGTHSVSFPIKILPAFYDPDEPGPDPLDPAKEDWLTARSVRFDLAQTLTGDQAAQALANIGISGIRSMTKTAGGFLEIEDAGGNPFWLPLTSGHAPA